MKHVIRVPSSVYAFCGLFPFGVCSVFDDSVIFQPSQCFPAFILCFPFVFVYFSFVFSFDEFVFVDRRFLPQSVHAET